MARIKGTPKTGGRTKGTPNKVTAQIGALAREYGEIAIKRLGELLQSPDDRVVIAACQALLDRGYGKPGQVMGLVAAESHRHVTEMSEDELIAIIEGSAPNAEDQTEH